MLLDIELADGTFRSLDHPITNTDPMERMETHKEGLLFPLRHLTQTNRALSILPSMLRTGQHL